MLLQIPQVLDAAGVARVRSIIDAGEWVDGNVTSGPQAAIAKRNAQLAETSKAREEAADIVLRALEKTPLFTAAALPLMIFPPLFNRYEGGQNFGNHVDNSVRRNRSGDLVIRTDLSATLFLEPPDAYDGGELVIEDTYGGHVVKLAAGDLILYPSTSLHHVTPVTRGARTACFFWLQSMVREDAKRTMLFDLDMSIQRLAAQVGLGDPSIVSLTGTYHNLLRVWAEI
ncbi:MAG TPA: Fe2+-dependent dioxygenase [Verrucomicrobiae bacterium]|nr:Fe2+-dependent dioxygenase [Verrucomicrobiae bacterium]